MKLTLVWILGACLGALAGCSAGSFSDVDDKSQADFVNGNFENGSLSAWTVTPHLNSTGIGVVPPHQLADLTLNSGGDATKTKTVTGVSPESVLAAGLQAGDSLMYPRFGTYSAVVNELGKNGNAALIVVSAIDLSLAEMSREQLEAAAVQLGERAWQGDPAASRTGRHGGCRRNAVRRLCRLGA